MALLEKKLSETMDVFMREGEHYQKDYPMVLNFIDLFYKNKEVNKIVSQIRAKVNAFCCFHSNTIRTMFIAKNKMGDSIL